VNLLDVDDRLFRRPVDFPFISERPLDGIIAQLTRDCGGNVVAEEIINLSASSIWGDEYAVDNAVDFDSDEDFATADVPDQFITYDFKDRKVELTGYTIQSRRHDTNWAYGNMKSWVIECGDDLENLTVVDQRTDDAVLNGKGKIHHFLVKSSKPARFIRVRHIGPGHHMQYFAYSALEFFGQLIG
jgi:hypothetical protein